MSPAQDILLPRVTVVQLDMAHTQTWQFLASTAAYLTWWHTFWQSCMTVGTTLAQPGLSKTQLSCSTMEAAAHQRIPKFPYQVCSQPQVLPVSTGAAAQSEIACPQAWHAGAGATAWLSLVFHSPSSYHWM